MKKVPEKLFAYDESNNAIAMYMQRVNKIHVLLQYAPLLPTDTLVSKERGVSDLVLRLSARLYELDADIRLLQASRDVESDASLFLPDFAKLTSLTTEFNFVMYLYLGKIQHEFPNAEYPSGFFTIRDKNTVVITKEVMKWLGEAALKSVCLDELYVFQRRIALSPLAGSN